VLESTICVRVVVGLAEPLEREVLGSPRSAFPRVVAGLRSYVVDDAPLADPVTALTEAACATTRFVGERHFPTGRDEVRDEVLFLMGGEEAAVEAVADCSPDELLNVADPVKLELARKEARQLWDKG
jgi:hypothetical protein